MPSVTAETRAFSDLSIALQAVKDYCINHKQDIYICVTKWGTTFEKHEYTFRKEYECIHDAPTTLYHMIYNIQNKEAGAEPIKLRTFVKPNN